LVRLAFAILLIMKAKHWKTVSSSEVLRHPRMHLIEDVVELPDGKTSSYLRHAPTKLHSVAIIAVNEKHEVLLQKEYSYPPDEVMWQLPGGEILEGEGVIEAANRELSEESGFAGSVCEELGFYYTNSRRSDAKQFVVLCTELKPRAGKRDVEEFIETYWLSIAKLREMIAAGKFNHALLLAALNLYFAQGSNSKAK